MLITVQKKLDSLYVGVPLADKKGGKGGTQSLTDLWILAQPCKVRWLEPTGKDLHISFYKLSFCS